MRKNYSISVVLPVYNEESNIEKTVEEAFNFFCRHPVFGDYEVIVVDDGSKDKTAEILHRLVAAPLPLRIVTLDTNSGYSLALMSGVKASRYPLIFLMDADGQFDISELNKFMPYIEDNHIIAGYRQNRRDSLYRIILGKTYGLCALFLFGLKLKDINCGFKLFKREILMTQEASCSSGVFYTKLFLKCRQKGYRIKEIPVGHFPRSAGKGTGASLKVIFNAVKDLFKLKLLIQ